MIPSLYIHIPFCRSRCLYCDFYSTIYNPDLAPSYVDALLKEAKLLNTGFSTIYIGGGTPTVLEASLLKTLLKGLKRFLRDDTEFTIEANPESLTEDKIKILLDRGVNRLSIGAQSFKDKKLQNLGRLHDSKRSKEITILASRKGFKNISVDLIYGVWDEDPDDWKTELIEAAKLPITHVSCYGLTYEKTTPLFNMLRSKIIEPLEDKTVGAMYELTVDYLSVRGFKQYEVSSFSKEGYRCAHNVNYWDNAPYIGLGASAVSYTNGTREETVANAGEYIRRVQTGEELSESSEELSPIEKARETAALKIRTKDGIDFAWFKEKTGFDFLELERSALKSMEEKNLIKYKTREGQHSGVCLRHNGFLFCDTVSSALL